MCVAGGKSRKNAERPAALQAPEPLAPGSRPYRHYLLPHWAALEYTGVRRKRLLFM